MSIKTTLCALILLLAAATANAQAIEGDWQGTLAIGPVALRLVLHLSRAANGGLAATLDSPDQGARGMAATTVSLTDSTLKFEVASIGGAYEGTANADRTAITGTWRQLGMSAPLNLTRAPAASAVKRVPKPSDIDGGWEGTLNAGIALRLVLHITTFEDGMTATLDSPDQRAFGIPATSVSRSGSVLQFEMKQIAGSFKGTLDSGLTLIRGDWTQLGNTVPLELKRLPKNP
jgi:hypothetical protein